MDSPASVTLTSTLAATHNAVAAQHLLLNSTEQLTQLWRGRRSRRRQRALRRRGRGAVEGSSTSTSSSPIAVVTVEASRASRLLVLGIISNPRTPHTREWIRRTYLSTAPPTEVALVRFVMGQRGLSGVDQRKLKKEHVTHGDLEYIDASDFADRGGIFSCIDKLFAWFPHAVHAYPGAAFYAKADDDSYVDVSRLGALLRPLTSLRNAYLGYVQYDSFITAEWKHCGWAAGPVGAAHAYAHGCPHGGAAFGPFPFVVGALTAMGADLAMWMRSSAFVRQLVADGRSSQSNTRHWDCGYSDVTLGYALAASNQSVSLVSVRNAMRDATYGAMNARTFVVSHHLRQGAQFDAAHAEAARQPAWRAAPPTCLPWAEVGSVGLPWAEAGSPRIRQRAAEEPSRAELQRAMRAFHCCQHWQLCELHPVDA